MKTRKPLEFTEIPSWAICTEQRDRYSIAAAFALAGLVGKSVRLTAKTQRALFGCNLFGKCSLTVDSKVTAESPLIARCASARISQTRFSTGMRSRRPCPRGNG